MEIVNKLTVALKGFFMGAANVVPGVSGGTIALITGIYSELIDALNSIMSISTWKLLTKGQWAAFWKTVHGTFLLFLFIGVLTSVFSLAKFMTWCLEYHPIQTWAFFFGLIIASSIVMLRDIKGWSFKAVCFAIFGVILGLTVCTLSPTETPDDLWFIFICGAIAICTMILPGISGSFILVILGKYDYVMEAISTLDIPVLIVFAAGCGIGILAFAKFLHYLLDNWEKQTMLVLLGFVLGSLVKVWPWNNRAALEAAQELRTNAVCTTLDLQIPSAIIWCVIGFALIGAIEVLKGLSRR